MDHKELRDSRALSQFLQSVALAGTVALIANKPVGCLGYKVKDAYYELEHESESIVAAVDKQDCGTHSVSFGVEHSLT